MQLSTTVWGPSLWRTLHSIAFSISYDHDSFEKRKQFFDLIESLRTLLPCEECRLHFEAYVNENKPQKASDLAYWTFELHNSVNKRLGKPQYSFDDVSKLYLNKDAQCTMDCAMKKKDEDNTVLVLGLVLLFSLLVLFCFKTPKS
jgi:hypothetical protein